MDRIDGYIGTNERDAGRIYEALKQGPVGFTWTEGHTAFDFFMVPSHFFQTAYIAPMKSVRWHLYGMVIVGIEKKGCFHFDLLSGTQEFYEDYVNEKLGLDPQSSDGEKIAELFNAISSLAKNAPRNILP